MIVGTTLTLSAQAAPDVKPQAPEPQVPPAAEQPQTPAPTPAQQPQPSSDTSGRFSFSVNIGGQSKEQTFTDSSTFEIYRERGALASAHAIGGGTLFDVGAAARVWKNFGVGIAYSSLTNRNDAVVSVRVPHPVVFGQSRTATATAEALEHSENAVHLQFMWTIPLTSKFQITAMAGPSFFTVRQTVATIQVPGDIRDVAPFTDVTITSVRVTDVKDSPVGVNVGVDGTYFLTTYQRIGIGVGAFARYSGASFDLETAPGVTRDNTDLKTGGPQGGIGLRLRF
jgi:hypothetical protein